MIRINQIKLPIFEVGTDSKREKELLSRKAASVLKCRTKDLRKLIILKRSIDARDKNDIHFVYSVNVRLHDSVSGPSAETEQAYISSLRNKNVLQETKKPLVIPVTDPDKINSDLRPVIIGSGPCGLFTALVLTESGFKPIILERGQNEAERRKKTELFFETGKLDPDCNIQFGEGGAGTFSDGKLNTGIKDQGGFIDYTLRTFVRFGADEHIIYDQKPHVGTDVLCDIVKNIRLYIEEHGGSYIFGARFDGIETEDNELKSVYYTDVRTGKRHSIITDTAVLAIGHSARDTYEILKELDIDMEAKAFAVGVRVQHPQELIDKALYGENRLSEKQAILGPAAYKLTHSAKNGRNVYSFCMCPGGYVVNSSSEADRLCINGMSYNKRDSGTANSALIVNVTPDDFPSDDVLAGTEFQRELESKAYSAAGGVIPYETYKEFKNSEKSPLGISEFKSCFLGYSAAADVRAILPDYAAEAIDDGIEAFGHNIKGFDSPDTLIAGIEARSSSPVRILRNEERCSLKFDGLYPAGEGAGYAGGITSAAVDGIRTALCIINRINN